MLAMSYFKIANSLSFFLSILFKIVVVFVLNSTHSIDFGFGYYLNDLGNKQLLLFTVILLFKNLADLGFNSNLDLRKIQTEVIAYLLTIFLLASQSIVDFTLIGTFLSLIMFNYFVSDSLLTKNKLHTISIYLLLRFLALFMFIFSKGEIIGRDDLIRYPGLLILSMGLLFVSNLMAFGLLPSAKLIDPVNDLDKNGGLEFIFFYFCPQWISFFNVLAILNSIGDTSYLLTQLLLSVGFIIFLFYFLKHFSLKDYKQNTFYELSALSIILICVYFAGSLLLAYVSGFFLVQMIYCSIFLMLKSDMKNDLYSHILFLISLLGLCSFPLTPGFIYIAMLLWKSNSFILESALVWGVAFSSILIGFSVSHIYKYFREYELLPVTELDTKKIMFIVLSTIIIPYFVLFSF